MPDRWDAEAIKALAEGFGGVESLRRHVEEAPVYCGDGWDGACAKDDCEVVAQVQLAATFARRAYREALERAEYLARIWPDGSGAGRDLAAAIRREIEGLDPGGQ